VLLAQIPTERRNDTFGGRKNPQWRCTAKGGLIILPAPDVFRSTSRIEESSRFFAGKYQSLYSFEMMVPAQDLP
jgi:hypothetical protein